jgi:hypothetical protein
LRLIGSYFELTDRVSGRTAGPAPAAAPPAGREGAPRRSQLLISVAKRLVRSAVRRNTVKRIVREAWRAATGASRNGGGNQHPTPRGTDIAEQGSQEGAQGQDGRVGRRSHAVAAAASVPSASRTCLVRLRRYPDLGADPKPSFAMIKRGLRRDADQLFARFLDGSATAVPGAPGGRRDPAGSRRKASPRAVGK